MTPIKPPDAIAQIPGNSAHIKNLLRALPDDVILFVGAGLSVDFGYPPWQKLLRDIADSGPRGLWSKVYPPGEKDLSEVASKIRAKVGSVYFDGLVKDAFDVDKLTRYPSWAAAQILPDITRGPIITTNLDRVLEETYKRVGLGFRNVVYGELARKVLEVPWWYTRLLIKFHGDYASSDGYILTTEQYDDAYGPLGTALDLDPETTSFPAAALLAALTTGLHGKPLFFLGCSLQQDRTLDVLGHLTTLHGAQTHWALVEQPRSTQKQYERLQVLDTYGIVPIWYPADQHGLVGEFLNYLVRASKRGSWRPKTTPVVKRLGSPE